MSKPENLVKFTLKMSIQLLKLYLKLDINRCKNDKHTPKNGDFDRKDDESML